MKKLSFLCVCSIPISLPHLFLLRPSLHAAKRCDLTSHILILRAVNILENYLNKGADGNNGVWVFKCLPRALGRQETRQEFVTASNLSHHLQLCREWIEKDGKHHKETFSKGLWVCFLLQNCCLHDKIKLIGTSRGKQTFSFSFQTSAFMQYLQAGQITDLSAASFDPE